MVPVGYMAKRISKKPDWLNAVQVIDVYSVSSCVSDDFADYVQYWKHNGYWFFDSPEVILKLAREDAMSLEGSSLFYYEAHEMQFDDESWSMYLPEPSFRTNAAPPVRKQIEGFDVVTFSVGSGPECSPLSCNSLATDTPTNAHCLLTTFDEAKILIEDPVIADCEPGPYRIFAVYSVDWPPAG